MALVNSAFTVNVTPGAMPPTVHVSEYDIGRTYTVTINGQNGSAFNIPTGTTATVEGTLNGVIGFTTGATISGSNVSFTLTESMTARSGKAWCKIKLTLNGEPIQTCAFVLAVDRAGVEADTVIGAPGFDAQIQDAVDNYLEEHPVPTVTVDPTLTISGAAADAKVTGEIKSAFDEIATVEQTTVPGSVNVYNPSNTTAGYYLNSSGVPQAGSGYGYSERIPCSPGDVVRFYVISNLNTFPGNLYYADESIGSVKAASDFYSPGNTGGVASFTVPANVTHFSINLRTGYNNEFIITVNNPYPESYVPYAPPVVTYEKKINDDVALPFYPKLHGKNIMFCGDSITYGAYADTDAFGNKKNFGWYIKQATGANAQFNAVSGSTMMNVTGKNPFSVNRYTQLGTDLDYIILAFVTNDSAEDNSLIGQYGDTTNGTFWGAWKIVLDYLIQTYPTAKIGIIGFWRGNQKYLWTDALREIAHKYRIPFLDFMLDPQVPMVGGTDFRSYYPNAPFTVDYNTMTARQAAFLADTVHPNDAGYQYLAPIIQQYIESL